MVLRQTILSPLLRSAGAFALVVYIAAQTLCLIHCNFGGGRVDSTLPSCHRAEAACQTEGDSSSPPTSAPTTTCFTLKNTLAGGDTSTLVVPQFFVLYLLTPGALALDTTAPKPEPVFFRRANQRDWVFTPEVSLGPAFRTLAPPLRLVS